MALPVNSNVKTGFWTGLGVLIALAAWGLVQALLGRIAK